MLKSASTLQSIRALSVGEAEYYAVVKGQRCSSYAEKFVYTCRYRH